MNKGRVTMMTVLLSLLSILTTALVGGVFASTLLQLREQG